MADKEKIEEYLLELELPYEKVAEDMWIVKDEYDYLDNIVLIYSPPILILRVKVMPVPEENKEELFRKLLELNATDLLHGAYAIDGNNIIIIDTLEVENLDLNELQASIEAISMALVQHYKVLSKYYKKEE